MKQPLIILAGPTASGKTALSIALAKRFDMEIISADSMQVYRGMDIGTAKVTKEEMAGVRHHLIDILDPKEEWNVMEFCARSTAAIDEITARGHLPLVVGGTGFYIHALAYGAEFEEEEPSDYREDLEKMSSEDLFSLLTRLDPESTKAIHINNRKRIIRAIEYSLHTGKPISELNERLKQKEPPYDLLFLVLDMPRDILYERIDRRVDTMLQDGLIDEVRRLVSDGCTKDMVSMKGLGYKEILSYFDGELSLEEAIYILKRDTRHFAKRQMTWMRREKDAQFISVFPLETLEERVADKIKAFLGG